VRRNKINAYTPWPYTFAPDCKYIYSHRLTKNINGIINLNTIKENKKVGKKKEKCLKKK